jgi:predicted metal-dependent hydrolase
VSEKPVRNLNLRILPPDGRVVLSCPPGTPEAQVAEMIEGHLALIKRARDRLQEAGRREFIPLDQARPVLAELLESIAPALLTRCRETFPKQKGYRQAPRLRIKQMSSLWGSYSRTSHAISLNSELAGLAPRYSEYVLAHELAHVMASGHGAPFHAALDKILPLWRPVENDLRHKRLPLR